MPKKSKAQSDIYWQRRSLEDTRRRINLTEAFISRKLGKYYKEAREEIRQEIEGFYQKYANHSGVSLLEAKRRIRTADFNDIDFRRMVEDAYSGGDRQQIDLVRRLSKKGQISRLEQLDLNINEILSRQYSQVQGSIYGYMVDACVEDYYQSIYNLNCFLEARTAFTIINEKVITQAVAQTWSKRHFSDAIWGHRHNLAEELRGTITKNLIKGSSIDKMSRDIARRLDVAQSNARRLARTEANYIHGKATLDAYENEAGIERYKFLATLDFRTSDICQALDGKTFKTSEAQAGINYPPCHPNCRSTTTPYMDISYKGIRIARDAKGKNYYVPADLSYKDWYDGLPEETKSEIELERKKARKEYRQKRKLEKK